MGKTPMLKKFGKIFIKPTIAEDFIVEVKEEKTLIYFAGIDIPIKYYKYKGDLIIEIELGRFLEKK